MIKTTLYAIGIVLVISVLVAILLIYILNIADKYKNDKGVIAQYVMEYGYFEGQKDALNGEIHITKISDSCWLWTDSPWTDKRETVYNPPCR
jgi:hypothetical protein